MANKTTKLENMTAVYTFMMNNDAPENLIDFLFKEIALLEKKKASRKPSKTQEANMAVKATIMDFLVTNADSRFRASEIASEVGISPNKASALLRQMVQAEQVERIEEKRVAYFKLATDIADTLEAE